MGKHLIHPKFKYSVLIPYTTWHMIPPEKGKDKNSFKLIYALNLYFYLSPINIRKHFVYCYHSYLLPEVLH